MYPDDFVDKMPQTVWQNGHEIGSIRLVANPMAHNGGQQKAKFIFEKKLANDGLGNACWISVQTDYNELKIDSLIEEFIKFKIAEKIRLSLPNNPVKDVIE